MLRGPVVITESQPLEIAAQLGAAALDHATASGITTVFARPQGLDRVWVRYGFIPVPESTLSTGLARPAGVGLYAWRGGGAPLAPPEAAPARPASYPHRGRHRRRRAPARPRRRAPPARAH